MNSAPLVASGCALARMPRRSEVIEAEIASYADSGAGIAALRVVLGPDEADRHLCAMIPGALVGEHVVFEVVSRRATEVRGKLLEVRVPSKARTIPRCAHAISPVARGVLAESTWCGGCSLQALDYDEQLSQKMHRVRALLEEVGLYRADILAPIIAAAEIWHYRNKMEFTFSTASDGLTVLGLYPAGDARQIVALSACHLLSPFTARFVPQVQAWARRERLCAAARGGSRRRTSSAATSTVLRSLAVREGKRSGDRLLELVTDGDDERIANAFVKMALGVAQAEEAALTSVIWTQRIARAGIATHYVSHTLFGKDTLLETLRIPVISGRGSLNFEIHPRAFFQPNTFGAERLYAEVLGPLVNGGTQGAGRPGVVHALDLCCGTGTIALCLSGWCHQVTGVEIVPEAVENARRNAALNGISNVNFEVADVADYTRRLVEDRYLQSRSTPIDLVVVDPPRVGLSSAALGALGKLLPPRIVYISCNPRSLVRDLYLLVRSGYQIERIQPLDLFPHTPHIECIVHLGQME